MTVPLLAIIERLPARQNEIRRMALASPAFRSLCEDYQDAQAALKRCDATPAGAKRRAEYLVLLSELGDEIEDALNAKARSLG